LDRIRRKILESDDLREYLTDVLNHPLPEVRGRTGRRKYLFLRRRKDSRRAV
jgi:hypothetical protein